MHSTKRQFIKSIGGAVAFGAMQTAMLKNATAQPLQDGVFSNLGIPRINLEYVNASAFALSRIANEDFGLTALPRISETEVRVEDERFSFVGDLRTGAINFMDFDLFASPEVASPGQDFSDEAAQEVALGLLRAVRGSLDDLRVTRIKPVHVDSGIDQPVLSHVAVEIEPTLLIERDVERPFEAMITGDPVSRICVNAQMQVVAARIYAPMFVASGTHEAHSIQEATENLLFALGVELNDEIETAAKTPYFAYHLDPPNFASVSLSPVYYYALPTLTHYGVFGIPASPEMPLARIRVEPIANGSRPVRFVADVRNGMAPYSFEWSITHNHSDQQDLVDASEIEPFLLEGAHYVSVKVTDQRAFTAATGKGITLFGEADTSLSLTDMSDWADNELQRTAVVPLTSAQFTSGQQPDFPAQLDWPDETTWDEPILYGEELEKLEWSTTQQGQLTVRTGVNVGGWTMRAVITPTDGLELRKIAFNGHVFANKFNVPFYYASTNNMRWQRAELKDPPAANGNGNCKSTLMVPGITKPAARGGGVAVVARYCVEDMPANQQGTMVVEQRFEFGPATRSMSPPPFNAMSEAPFFPLVSYRFAPQGGNRLRSIEFDYRLDFDVLTTSDQVAMTREKNVPVPPIFNAVRNPVTKERSFMAVGAGGRPGGPGAWDNYHHAPDYSGVAPVRQAALKASIKLSPIYPAVRLMEFIGFVDAPNFPFPIIVPSGSPLPNDCVHIHWRWGQFLGVFKRVGFAPQVGAPMAPGQIVEVYPLLVRQGESDPVTVAAITNGQGIVGTDIVFWYRAQSFGKQADTFFQHGGFFV